MKTSITIAAPQTTSSGPKCLSGGIVRPAIRRAADGQQLAVLVQVAREEDDDADLRDLRRLEGERAEVDLEVGAVHLRADARQPRRHQQQDPDGRDQVAVALEHVVVAQEEDRRREQGRPGDEDRRLLQRQQSLIRNSITRPIAASSAQSGNRYGSA